MINVMRANMVILVFALLVAGCMKLGPDYARPDTAVLANWHEADGTRVTNEPVDYRAWWRVFHDPVLDRLIETAHRQNLSLRVAGVRVLEARAQLGIAVGQLYPQTQQAVGSLQYNRLSPYSIYRAPKQPHHVYAGPGRRHRELGNRLLGEVQACNRVG